MINIHDLTAHLHSEGADLIGFANLGMLSSKVQRGLPFGISLGVAFHPQVISAIHNGPTHEYYAEYERANQLLDRLAHCAATMLHEHGHQAMCLAVTEIGIDPKTHSTALPHKTVATRAGLGWIGKYALLVTEAFGSAIRLTTVLTDARLPAGTPIDSSRCGACCACVDACPGHAPSGEEWHVTRHRDQFFDVIACRTMAREMAVTRIQVKNTICGICIGTCPWTKKYSNRHQKRAGQD
jgi:epoxyqueuosine reductase QueG